MKRMVQLIWGLVLTVGLAFVTEEGFLKGSAIAAEAGRKAAANASSLPVYKPPMRGAPRSRIGGGTRGSSSEYPGLVVLAPDHPGLTAREQPVLFWYLANATDLPVEFTLIGSEGIQPLVEKRLAKERRAGIQRLDLADFGVHLAPGAEYQWYISVILDEEHPSRNIVSGATVKHAELQPEEVRRIFGGSGTELPFLYAEHGLWYDAFAAVQSLLGENPEESSFRQQQISLLSQVGLQLNTY